MATGKALDGKPYAGNPHVRFDEGEVAPVATPRRGSLLYNAAIYRIALVLPFLLPIILGVSEDRYGRSMLLRCVYAIVFFGALIVSYAVNLRRAIRPKCRADSLYELLVFHLVKIPLYVLVWIVAMLIFVLTTFSFDGIQ